MYFIVIDLMDLFNHYCIHLVFKLSELRNLFVMSFDFCLHCSSQHLNFWFYLTEM